MVQTKIISNMTTFEVSKEEYLLLAIEKGEGKYYFTPYINEFQIYDLFFIPPGSILTITPEHFTNCGLILLTIPASWLWQNSRNYYIYEAFRTLLTASRNIIHLSLTKNDFSGIRNYFFILKAQDSGSQLHTKLISQHLITALFLQLSELHYSRQISDTQYKASRKRLMIEKAKYYIEQNYPDSISLQTLSTMFHINPTYFSRAFKAVTGICLSDYINHVRIERSKLFLVDTDELIVDIAAACGFNYTSQFNSTFKKLTGMSPGQYRKEKKSEPV